MHEYSEVRGVLFNHLVNKYLLHPPIPLCKCSHHGQFETTNGLTDDSPNF